MDHSELFDDTWENKECEWLPYPKNDVLSTAFSHASFSKSIEEITGSGMKKSITLPSFANKYFNSLRDESDQPFYTYSDEYMRCFVRQSPKGGLCVALNQ